MTHHLIVEMDGLSDCGTDGAEYCILPWGECYQGFLECLETLEVAKKMDKTFTLGSITYSLGTELIYPVGSLSAELKHRFKTTNMLVHDFEGPLPLREHGFFVTLYVSSYGFDLEAHHKHMDAASATVHISAQFIKDSCFACGRVPGQRYTFGCPQCLAHKTETEG
jgi:hypothetical protein